MGKRKVNNKSRSELKELYSRLEELKKRAEVPFKPVKEKYRGTIKEVVSDEHNIVLDLGLRPSTRVNYLVYFGRLLDKIPTTPTKDWKERLIFVTVILVFYFFIVNQPAVSVAIAAIAFAYYMLVSSKPKEVVFIITTQGISIDDVFYLWEDLESFWVARSEEGYYVLYIHTRLRFPTVIAVVTKDRTVVREITLVLGNFLPYVYKSNRNFLTRFTYGEVLELTDIISAKELMDEKTKLVKEVTTIVERSIEAWERYRQQVVERVRLE